MGVIESGDCCKRDVIDVDVPADLELRATPRATLEMIVLNILRLLLNAMDINGCGAVEILKNPQVSNKYSSIVKNGSIYVTHTHTHNSSQRLLLSTLPSLS